MRAVAAPTVLAVPAFLLMTPRRATARTEHYHHVGFLLDLVHIAVITPFFNMAVALILTVNLAVFSAALAGLTFQFDVCDRAVFSQVIPVFVTDGAAREGLALGDHHAGHQCLPIELYIAHVG